VPNKGELELEDLRRIAINPQIITISRIFSSTSPSPQEGNRTIVKITIRLITTASSWQLQKAGDWINNDSNGALRIAAWKDGGVNDICPAGFSVPNKGELIVVVPEVLDS
jgi:hypothetical protein